MQQSTHRIIAPLVNWQVYASPHAIGQSEWGDIPFAAIEVPVQGRAVDQAAAGRNPDDLFFYFRCCFQSPDFASTDRISLQFDGLATLSTVWLNQQPIASQQSMFESFCVDISALVAGSNEILIQCQPLTPALRARRQSPPALRWKTRLVTEQQLRFVRTTLAGRAPGLLTHGILVGPWRPVFLVQERAIVLTHWHRSVQLSGADGLVQLTFCLHVLEPASRPVSGILSVGTERAQLAFRASGALLSVEASILIRNVKLWWPHTHGEPVLYPVQVELQFADGSFSRIQDVACGFRHVAVSDAEYKFQIQVNETPVFCRGVVWNPCEGSAYHRLRLLRDAGFNLIRIPGTTYYAMPDFHAICDSLGLLIWQDLMFANMDYPFDDDPFLRAATTEVVTELSRLAAHPSTAIICGNSEVEQQARMFGASADYARAPFFAHDLPLAVERYCPGVPYIPSAPFGGDLPFRTDRGVSNYFGVGAYLRPIDDARRSEVRFASECLAFANVPSAVHPGEKRGVPRDSGAWWDFEDVRDHYLKVIYTDDPAVFRRDDAERYWELSRMVSGEVMADVLGEWRRSKSPCQGAIILWSGDTVPGAGWGILDSEGQPKAAYFFLKRVLQPVTVFMTGEGLNGVDVHVANDGPCDQEFVLQIALYRNCEQQIATAEIRLLVEARQTASRGIEELLGRFADASYAYRFGPPAHDVIVATLWQGQVDGQEKPHDAQAFYFPLGRNVQRYPIEELQLACTATVIGDNDFQIRIQSERLAYGVCLQADGFEVDDCYFSVAPRGERTVRLRPRSDPQTRCTSVTVTAVNAWGAIRIALEQGS